MTNLDALKALCTKICAGFYPDKAVLELSLIDNGISPTDEYTAKNAVIARQAISIVKGMTETSHSEAGISEAWNPDAVRSSIIAMCREYGLDESEFVEVSSIEDGSNLW